MWWKLLFVSAGRQMVAACTVCTVLVQQLLFPGLEYSPLDCTLCRQLILQWVAGRVKLAKYIRT